MAYKRLRRIILFQMWGRKGLTYILARWAIRKWWPR